MLALPVLLLVAVFYLAWRAVRAVEVATAPSAEVQALAERIQLIEDENSMLTDRLNRLADQQDFTERLLQRPGPMGSPPNSA